MRYEKIKVLITVKTYPLPSRTYQELVCTAGVREDGSFIRLYPIDYRYRPYWQWYKKYQWIEVEVTKNQKDPRKESYRPKVETIRPLGKPLPTKNKWQERKNYVLAQGYKTIEELKELQKIDHTSLGIIKPKIISDFSFEETEKDWEPAQKIALRQQRLFGPENKPLEKIPFKFFYHFTCTGPRCNGHKMQIIDWELGQLYRRMRHDYKFSPEKSAEKVKEKFFNQICSPNRDTYFFVGTVLPFHSWIVLGVFWPPK